MSATKLAPADPIEFPADVYSHSSDNELKMQKPRVFKSKMFFIAIAFSSIIMIAMITSFILYYKSSPNHDDDGDRSSYYEDNDMFTQLPAEQREWFEKARDELNLAMKRQLNNRKAKNVIVFVGDGMGPNTVTAARIMHGGEDDLLVWENFPDMGLLKTYCADKQVPDSFSTATALFSGVKVNYETGGVDSSVSLGNCSASLDSQHHVYSMMKWAQDANMLTGFVTNTRVTHATPAALYAHSADRRWECESKIPEKSRQEGCKDIAIQLIENPVARKLNVIMGGGRQMLVSNATGTPADPIDTWSCYSKDGRDLIKKWSDIKTAEGKSHMVVQNTGELINLDPYVNHVMGIFANGHMSYEHERNTSETGMPSLAQMTQKAVQILNARENGFMLVVEGGMIDQAHHRGTAKKALNEVIALNDAVSAAIKELRLKGTLEDTLIIVTADHSHTLTINGHPPLGNDILGIAGKSKTDGIDYTTLTYGTTYQGFQADASGKRSDPSQVDTTDWEYTQQGVVNTDENYHGGSDVTIYARGPKSHLIQGVHEQSYVAHLIAYTLRIGRFEESPVSEAIGDTFGGLFNF